MSLITRETQVKTTARHHLTPNRVAPIKQNQKIASVGGDVKKLEPCMCWWECKMVQLLRKMVWWFLKNLKTELPYNPAIPLVHIFPKELKTGTRKGICTPIFRAALFTAVKRWTQPKCPSVDDG